MTGTRGFGSVPAAMAAFAFAAAWTGECLAQAVDGEGIIKSRHIGVSRGGAASNPRSEGDQRVVEGWPLYRTERGQAAFNDAMATLKATEGPTPQPKVFAPCLQLQCNLKLPEADAAGWLAQGRLWVSPTSYVLFVQSPRLPEGRSYRRRTVMSQRYFVFHEFHNSSRNTDMFDTISSHAGGVYVPFYLSKESTDAKARRFVTVVQVAPYDVASIHATNWGSAGPGIEVAKNMSDVLEPLQATAGVLVAAIVRQAVPRLQAVNHRGEEGRAMLDAYEQRQTALRGKDNAAAVALPFIVALPNKIVTASAKLEDLVKRESSAPVAMADRGFVPRRSAGSRSWRSAALVQRASVRSEDVVAGPQLIEQPRPVARPGFSIEPPRLVGPIRPAERPLR